VTNSSDLLVYSPASPHHSPTCLLGETELVRHLDASTPGEVTIVVELLPVPASDAACKKSACAFRRHHLFHLCTASEKLQIELSRAVFPTTPYEMSFLLNTML